jgi:hypothetical protein
MSNLTASSASTFTLNSTGGLPCQIHGGLYCNCTTLIQCGICNQFYNSSLGNHLCLTPTTWTTTGNTYPYPYTNLTWATQIQPTLKEIKEITTDSELIYEWDGSSFKFNMKLPVKFSDCFLKVRAGWSPLYPLIFSALENDEKTASFHLIVGIIDKKFEGDNRVFTSVTTTKIEDNLTLLQLTQRVRDYFKEDATTN